MIKSFLSVAFATILLGTVGYGQSTSSTTLAAGTNEVTETPTTAADNAGTVTEFTPGETMILKTEAAEPVHYTFSKTVTFVTVDGKTINASKIVRDSKVRVHYVKDGDNLVINKVTLTPDGD